MGQSTNRRRRPGETRGWRGESRATAGRETLHRYDRALAWPSGGRLHSAGTGRSALEPPGAHRKPQGRPRPLDGRFDRRRRRFIGGRLRGPPEGKVEDAIVYILRPLDGAGGKWEKQVLDAKGLCCEDVICADLNGDGRIDIIGVGRGTKNVKIYWNEGRRR